VAAAAAAAAAVMVAYVAASQGDCDAVSRHVVSCLTIYYLLLFRALFSF